MVIRPDGEPSDVEQQKERDVIKDDSGGASQDVEAKPEFTTRPRRLLMIGRMLPGQESDVLAAHERLPFGVAAAAGIDAIEAFVGSGHYAMLLEIDADNAQESLAAYFNDPQVREFHAELRPLVSGLPIPEWEYVASDGPHKENASREDAARESGPTYSSADLPLAASMYRWKRDGSAQ